MSLRFETQTCWSVESSMICISELGTSSGKDIDVIFQCKFDNPDTNTAVVKQIRYVIFILWVFSFNSVLLENVVYRYESRM